MRARNYRRISGSAYTRKEYIGGLPPSRIVHFEMGDPKGVYEYEARLIALENAQVRHNALEAARLAVNKLLERRLGTKAYFFKIAVYPHHVLREHKMMTGAGADRLSRGMSMAFGRPVGLAARVRKGQRILFVHVNSSGLDVAKEALRRGARKLPMPTRIEIIPLTEEA